MRSLSLFIIGFSLSRLEFLELSVYYSCIHFIDFSSNPEATVVGGAAVPVSWAASARRDVRRAIHRRRQGN